MSKSDFSVSQDGASSRWLEAIVAEYAGPLHGFFLRRVNSPSDAEDLVQEVFARLAQMETLAEVDSPRAYIFQVAVNLLKDRARRADARRNAFHEPFDDAFHGEDHRSPEDALLARDDLRRLGAALRKLPQKTQQVFFLHRFDGLKYREIAAAMGLSVSTVEKHMITALAEITQQMKEPSS